MTLAELLPTLRASLRAHLDSGVWPATARWGTHGDLLIGGVRMTTLAATYGTPVHVLADPDVRRGAPSTPPRSAPTPVTSMSRTAADDRLVVVLDTLVHRETLEDLLRRTS